MTVKKAMVLAAGFGTRLGALTKVTPKPLIHVGGEPILFRILNALELRGIEEVVVNTHYLAEQIHDALDQWCGEGRTMTVTVSHEEELLEIGGGLKKACSLLGDEPFLVVNGDIVWQEQRHPLLQNLMSAYDAASMDALMALVPTASSHHMRETGDVHVDNAHRVHFKEAGKPLTHVYMGIQVVHPRLLAGLPEGKSFLRPAWLEAEQRGSVRAFFYDDPWSDMGSPEGLLYAEELVKPVKCA